MAIKCKLINDQAMERQWPVLDAFQLFRMQDVLITAKKLLAGPADLTLLLEQTLIDMLTITNE